MAPEEAPEFFEEVSELEQAEAISVEEPSRRHGLREYSSENGPLVHRDNRGRHMEVQRTVTVVATPSQVRQMEAEKAALLSGAKIG